MKNLMVHWGSILAGVFIAMAGMVFFSLFALAVGIGGVNVITPLLPTISLGAAIYSIVSAMLSFSLAGYCAARMGDFREPGPACLQALTTFSVAGALVPFLFTRTIFLGPPGFALAPAPGMYISSGMAWTLFLSFSLAAVSSCAGGVQACYRENRIGGLNFENDRSSRAA